MNYKDQIYFIQKVTGLNQDDLASKLGVTFAALNRWLNDKATPRKITRQKIDSLYSEIVGDKNKTDNVSQAKKQFLMKMKKEHKNVVKEIISNPDIKDQFILSLTYNSNTIEGNTLSENETAAVIFHNKTFPGKSLTEHLEAKNHQTALDYLFDSLISKHPINEKLILKLHEIIMSGIHSDAGFYRRHAVRIVGANIPVANYIKIPYLMERLVKDIHDKSDDTITHAAIVHSKFEQIHPFGDGNGRVGRLLLNAMLLKGNTTPALIKQKEKHKYYTCLNKAQISEDYNLLEEFIIDSILEGYKILKRIKNKV